MRKKVFTVKLKDLVTTTFRAGGPGGQNQNKRDTGVRLSHPPSGAVAESREGRTQLENKRRALAKLADDPKFKAWCRVVALKLPDIDQIIDDITNPKYLKIEVKKDGKWVESSIQNSKSEST